MLKKKKGGGEKVRKKCVNERETLSYEQQIVDYNRQLSRFVYDEEIKDVILRNLILFFMSRAKPMPAFIDKFYLSMP